MDSPTSIEAIKPNEFENYKDIIRDIRTRPGTIVPLGKIYERSSTFLGCALIISMLSMLVMTPLGAVPGMPALCGVVMFLACLNVMITNIDIKLPKFLATKSLSGRVVNKTCIKLEAMFGYVDRVSERDRMDYFLSGLSVRAAMVATMGLSLCMIFLGYVPFLPTALMLPVLLFSMAILLKDGLFMLGGFVITSVLVIAAVKLVAGII